ncbi:M penetrans paralogue family 26 [Salegentibacter echinorum]|uniref:M penetrans paralogue family 26 n=1 Tax=Salegentibacter echinorum TaxID=1073325 RepID=A0A1M5CKE3_SALEC|nr:CCC motif membrane protein [Salegentibacter echinorum]SHF55179.1 M penetrans paralogue family 26 [Salegentibacter echinorum]
MQKQQLPNSTLILIFGILSIIGCCCYGLVGIIFGIIALVMAKRATAIYNANPELYTGYNNVKTGKILAIIGLVLSILSLIGTIASFIMYGGIEGMQEMQEEILREIQENQ